MSLQLLHASEQTGEGIEMHIEHKLTRADHLLASVLWDTADFKRSRGEKQDFMVMLDFPCSVKAFAEAVFGQNTPFAVERNGRHDAGIAEQTEITAYKIPAPAGEDKC